MRGAAGEYFYIIEFGEIGEDVLYTFTTEVNDRNWGPLHSLSGEVRIRRK
jgi:hypothetical protein